jgi:hypothetical protein
VKEDLHEISGIPDIARGQSEASETLGAQELKTSFAINRISDAQRDVQRFVREEIRLIVDIIAGHFQLETIKKISGVRLFTQQEKAEIKHFHQATQMAQQAQQQPPQPGMPPAQPMPPPPPPQSLTGLSQDQIETMMADPSWEEIDALIRNDAMRCFRIDIETDSTIKADEEQDKASRIEFITAIGKYMAEALPAGQQHPELVPFLLEGLQFLARGFPVGKNMESALNNAVAKLEKIAQNPPPKQDPEMAKVQAQAAAAQQKMTLDHQAEMASLNTKYQIELATAQLKAQGEREKAQNQAALQQHLNQLENERHQNEIAMESRMREFEANIQGLIDIRVAHINNAGKIAAAQVTAKASDGAEAEQRESSQE